MEVAETLLCFLSKCTRVRRMTRELLEGMGNHVASTGSVKGLSLLMVGLELPSFLPSSIYSHSIHHAIVDYSFVRLGQTARALYGYATH